MLLLRNWKTYTFNLTGCSSAGSMETLWEITQSVWLWWTLIPWRSTDSWTMAWQGTIASWRSQSWSRRYSKAWCSWLYRISSMDLRSLGSYSCLRTRSLLRATFWLPPWSWRETWLRKCTRKLSWSSTRCQFWRWPRNDKLWIKVNQNALNLKIIEKSLMTF